jgi:hypothetical protein
LNPCLSGNSDSLCKEFLKNDFGIWKRLFRRSHPMLNGELDEAWQVFEAQLQHQPAGVPVGGILIDYRLNLKIITAWEDG